MMHEIFKEEPLLDNCNRGGGVYSRFIGRALSEQYDVFNIICNEIPVCHLLCLIASRTACRLF
jgi:hypothetical protein